jgi:hypothetical protein
MKPLSYWARSHSLTAVFLIVFIKIALVILSVNLGVSLAESGIYLSLAALTIPVLIIVIICFLYPGRAGNREFGDSFAFRKFCDFSFAACCFVLFTYAANTLDNKPLAFMNTYGSVPFKDPTAEQILSSLKHRDKSSLTKTEKKILRLEFKKQVKLYAKYTLLGKSDEASETSLIILTIVAALGLLGLLSVLVCNLSCNGAEAAAVIVGVLGLAGIVWGTVVVIKRISKKNLPRPG